MSDYRAIQGVTTSIKTVLEQSMFLNRSQVAPADKVKITVGLPDKTSEDGRRVNIFLYQVLESACLKNQDLPGASGAGEYGAPPLSLDLHYLITAYGESEDGDQIEAHQILGDAMRTLHDHPFLVGSVLDASLQGAFERVKITMMPLTVEDLTKIWVSLATPYRISVGYQVTVVQIQSRLERTYPGRVAESPGGGPRLVVMPMRLPRINEVMARRPGDPADRERTPAYARIGDTLILKGTGLSTPGLRVLLGTADATASVTSRGDAGLEITIAEDVALQQGGLGVAVVRGVMLGDPPVPHRGFSSNLGAFVLTPRIAALTPNLAVNPRTLTITGTRLFQENRECLTLVGEVVIRAESYINSATDTIQVNLPASLGAGTYAVRVRVNGAESLDTQNLVLP